MEFKDSLDFTCVVLKRVDVMVVKMVKYKNALAANSKTCDLK